MRKFSTGATRNEDTTKNDLEGFIDPLFLEAFGDYMTEHRIQSDGTLRDSDNWQKGIPTSAYMKSLLRHVFDVWKIYRGHEVIDKDTNKEVDIINACCGVMFNIQGIVFNTLRGL